MLTIGATLSLLTSSLMTGLLQMSSFVLKVQFRMKY